MVRSAANRQGIS